MLEIGETWTSRRADVFKKMAQNVVPNVAGIVEKWAKGNPTELKKRGKKKVEKLKKVGKHTCVLIVGELGQKIKKSKRKGPRMGPGREKKTIESIGRKSGQRKVKEGGLMDYEKGWDLPKGSRKKRASAVNGGGAKKTPAWGT